jgi:hypothetical protein
MDGFWTDNVENTPDAVKYQAVGKFEPKTLVWRVNVFFSFRSVLFLKNIYFVAVFGFGSKK